MKNYFTIFIAVFIAYAPAIAWALPPKVYFRRPAAAVGLDVNHAVFDGSSTYLRVSSASPTGLADGTIGTIAFWVKFDPATDGVATYIFSIGQGVNEAFMFAKRATNTLVFRGYDEFANKDMDVETTGTWTSADGWMHIMACWDLSSTSLRKVYVNGVSQATTAVSYNTSPATNTLNYFTSGNTRITIGGSTADTVGLLFKGGIAEFLWDDTYNDVIGDYYSGGKAVALGTNGEVPIGTSPVFYFSAGGTGDSWTTNGGTGGALTKFGTFTTDGSPPQYP